MGRYNGYAMWPDLMQRVDADASLYATLFMACAVKKGAPDISEADLRDSLEILTRDGDTLNTPAREAYYCHVCAVAGRPNFSWMSRLQELAEQGKTVFLYDDTPKELEPELAAKLAHHGGGFVSGIAFIFFQTVSTLITDNAVACQF